MFLRSICTININAINSLLKKSLLKDFIWNSDIDIVFLQEVAFEDFGFLPSHTAIVNISTDNKSTAILVRKNINFDNVLINPNGRLSSILIDDINFINVYAPSGSNYRNERNSFFTFDIIPHLSFTKKNIIVGDFNCILLPSDSNSSNKNICSGLQKLVTSLNLHDIEHKINQKTNFTFIRGDSKSRLDRFYAPLEFISMLDRSILLLWHSLITTQ